MKQQILNEVADMVTNFLYYDRKEDEDLGIGVIDEEIKYGRITVDEIVNHFKTELEKRLM